MAAWRIVTPSCLRLRGLLRRLASGLVGLTTFDPSDRDSSRSWACSPTNRRYSDKPAAIVSFALVLSSHLIRTGVGRRSRLIAIMISAADSSPSRKPPFLGSLPRAVKASTVRLR
ncbi:hypothetical protein T4B_2321 [Trichinella pseudospiralis]|uniref:Uncharacterized protein n=1 Tax=Trichinella pseudospiralis TaxID=6337 RepID=A0A0V1ILY5_TRIPS|nr:hypothetical protein T4A_5674 [Trichinella pseudospiralis]KRZ23769.1 hypothetical protein T4B_2321 [Trichinella pseudospiralis]KRZ40480.1 hypothetical protein T4C_1922 [Trichinella pseudospiralis]